MSLASSARFYRQLSLVHRAGIAIGQAVELAGRASGGRHARMAKLWSDGCARGGTLSEQLAGTAEPRMAVALVHAGERSGRLPEVAVSLADYYDHLILLRDMVVSRLMYPMLLLHVTLFIPGLVAVFTKDKPIWVALLGPLGLWAVIGALVSAYLFTRASGLLGRMMMAWPLSFLFKPFVELNTFQVLRLAYHAGMLTPDALELAAGGCGSRVMEGRLRDAAVGVRQGRLADLTAALESCDFSRTPLDLIRNGELAGKTEETLRQSEVLAQSSFQARTMWTLRLVTGAIYGLAMLVAACMILSMWGAYAGQFKEPAGD